MTPAARVQAAIEVLDAVIVGARSGGAPADRILSDWFRARRFAGSSDRRAVRELVYSAIRACGEIPGSGRAAMLRLALGDPALAALFTGEGHAPAPVDADEEAATGGIAPAWLEELLRGSGVEREAVAALLARAPLDVRINPLRPGVPLPEGGEPTQAPLALRFPAGAQIEQSEAFRAGAVEIQDTGSQLACMALDAAAGETVIDLCAGAGGKTLALAAAMDNRGRIVACDTDRGRLGRLGPRAERAGAAIIETMLLDPGREAAALGDLAAKADAVLVDAPCSGTGTWRRNPEARWRLTPALLARYGQLQARLLDIAAGLVRHGGRLVFVTCSLLDAEGPDQAAGFLARHPGWRADIPALAAGCVRGQGLRLSPARDATDGFFIARFVRV